MPSNKWIETHSQTKWEMCKGGLEASPRPWSCTFILGVQILKDFQLSVMEFERSKYVNHVILKTLTCHSKVVDEGYKIMMSCVWIKSISWEHYKK